MKNIKGMTVRGLIKELEKMDPDAIALCHFRLEVGRDIYSGYVPYTTLKTIKVVRDRIHKDWYTESKSPKAIKIVAVS